MLVLLIGDTHIPHRAADLPAKVRFIATTANNKFKKLLVPGKIAQILCTGNLLDTSTYDYLRQIAPDFHQVKGECDDDIKLPLAKIITLGSFRIGLTNGFTIVPAADSDQLLIAARQMNVDVLISGSTHRFEAYEFEGKFFVNPGSATGAFSPGGWENDEVPTPSFVLMDVQDNLLVLYVYSLVKDEVKVEKFKFEKSVTE